MTDIFTFGVQHEEAVAAELRKRGYAVDAIGQGAMCKAVKEAIRNTHDLNRFIGDYIVAVPGRPTWGPVYVDPKTYRKYRVGPDQSVEIARLMVAMCVTGATVFVGPSLRCALASEVIENATIGCCKAHLDLLHAAQYIDNPLAGLNRLPEKCAPTNGSGDPYVWAPKTLGRPIDDVFPYL